jgi:hypothetical protein
MPENRLGHLPVAVQRKLQVYFCDTRLIPASVACVVTGKRDYTWHHLNHRPKDHRLSNIVPLIQDLNRNLYHAMNNAVHLDPVLECEQLKNIADTAFWLDGQVARAFGCTRIGYYVAQYKGRPFSDQLDWACQALYYARHKPNYQILSQLVADTILKPLANCEDAIQKEVVRKLLQEFEALLTLGGDTEGAASLGEYSRNALPPQDGVMYAGALRRRAHSIGTVLGPTIEVLNLLRESADVVSSNTNQTLNVASTKNNLYLGEGTTDGYEKVLDIASENYDHFIKSKIDVHEGRVRPKSKATDLPALPVRASPSNIAHLALSLCVGLAVNKPRHWRDSLQQLICVDEYYWSLAGARIDGPGRGSWRRVIASLNSADPLHARLISLIDRLEAPPFPSSLKHSIYKAARTLVGRLR